MGGINNAPRLIGGNPFKDTSSTETSVLVSRLVSVRLLELLTKLPFIETVRCLVTILLEP